MILISVLGCLLLSQFMAMMTSVVSILSTAVLFLVQEQVLVMVVATLASSSWSDQSFFISLSMMSVNVDANKTTRSDLDE